MRVTLALNGLSIHRDLWILYFGYIFIGGAQSHIIRASSDIGNLKFNCRKSGHRKKLSE